jgi:hypothetical protein
VWEWNGVSVRVCVCGSEGVSECVWEGVCVCGCGSGLLFFSQDYFLS